MRVRLTFGLKAGEVVDLPVLSARAMLADGRATSPEAPFAAASGELPHPMTQETAREDRGMPRGKRRAVR